MGELSWAVDGPGGGGLAGAYDLKVVNRDGSTDDGSLVIEEGESRRLYLRWPDDEYGYEGQGVVVGDSLLAVWGSAEAQCFMMMYQVRDDGGLDGFWFRATDRSPALGKEKATPTGEVVAGEISSAYSVEGTAPDGTPYVSEMSVVHLEGDFYRFRWQGEPLLEGIGQMDAGGFQVIASYAGHEGQCGKSEFRVDESGVLHGTWTMNDGDYKTRGTETATPRR